MDDYEIKMKEILSYSFIQNNIGNAVAYMQLEKEIPEMIYLTPKDFDVAYSIYYIVNSGRCQRYWLHQIYKNECKYDIYKTYEMVMLYMSPEK
jgi:anaerobic selenocysteine-containing dehydrogenase